MARCDVCGKTAGHGHKVSHSKRHSNRLWLPNVHKKKIAIGGETVRLSICTRCQRSLHKASA